MISSEDNRSSRASATHVAVLAFPFGTHAAPLFTFAGALAAAAPATTFSFLSSARSLAALPSTGLDNLKVFAVSDGCPDPPPVSVEEQIGMFLRATPGNFREAMEAAVAAAGGVAVSCVVSDAFIWMAGEMGLPWVALWTGGPAGLLAHLYTHDLRTRIGVEEQAVTERADELLTFIPCLSTIRVRDLPEGIVHGSTDSGFSVLLHRMAEALPHATAVAFNTFEGLDPDIDAELKHKLNEYLPIGPLNLIKLPQPEPKDPNGCLPFLDQQEHASVAYISFGTVMSLAPAELTELAEGLELSGIPFLWSLKEKTMEYLPPGFLERTKGRGLVVAWTPQASVLRHAAVGVFVTHCGWNSVMESVTSGVPMVCRPFFGDQKINARFVSHVWGIGVGLEGTAVAAALKTVLRSEEGKKMREKARELLVRAAFAVRTRGGLGTLLK
uniref:Glycosyltransferase n=1 Tax=Tulipa fosteriana TaxID=93697 RepID=A0A0U2DCB6_9LILI|nr:anthocyanidin 3-O-glucosyltransferase [Tulipa fosteriana]